MKSIDRREFVGLSAAVVGQLAWRPAWGLNASSQETNADLNKIYDHFKDPDRRYSIRPFWFWNGTLTADELRRQIKQMVDHGVYGAYAHNRDGLQTPYLSEAWWNVLGDAFAAAKEYGFSLCLVDDFEWPSGEARDYWLPGSNKSRVVQANADYAMRRLRPEETRVKGGRTVSIPLNGHTAVAVAGKLVAANAIDGDTLTTLKFVPASTELQWDAPAGDWIIITYSLERGMGQPDHGTVDLMSREAVREYIKIYYEELHRRHGKYFGNVLPATFADHEGNYGAKLPWTPRLFETFRAKSGYSLEPFLPALNYDIGAKTEKIRCDLLNTISELYSENFFKQVSEWCGSHGIYHSGHVWEESLFFGPAYQGDFFRILRSLTHPGCDSLDEWGRQSVWLKEVASVADFERRQVVCENQGVQGESSYLSPERMRRVSNALGAWNIGEFIPHAFDYDLSRTNYPPDWFRSQPFLPWFHSYADQMRRISYMNRDSHEVADILLFYPQVSVWGQATPAFSTISVGTLLSNDSWSEDAAETNELFAELKLLLSENRMNFQVADEYYLSQSEISGRRLAIRDSAFQVLILPPMSTISRAAAARAQQFFEQGGAVIAMRRLATTSVEHGRNDSVLVKTWSSIFDGSGIDEYRGRTNAAGGRSLFHRGLIPDLIKELRQQLDMDVALEDGPPDHLYVLHKIKQGIHFFWVVNDTADTRTNMLAFRATGRPERWNAESAERQPVFYQSIKDRTLVRLTLGPWDAAYIVFDPRGPAQVLQLKQTNIDDFHVVRSSDKDVTLFARSIPRGKPLAVELVAGGQTFAGEHAASNGKPMAITGNWKVNVQSPEIWLPEPNVWEDPGDVDAPATSHVEAGGEGQWQSLWLSPMNATFREWNVIGAFENSDDTGLDRACPPETSIDYSAVYQGRGDVLLHWQHVNAAGYHLSPEGNWNIGTMRLAAGPYGDLSYIVDYGLPLRDPDLHGTVYAQTNVYSDEPGEAVLVLATANPRAVFLNGEKVDSEWLRPLYSELTDGFARFIPVRLQQGWNSLLLKFLHNPENPQAPRFTCRLQRKNGTLFENVFCSLRASDHAAPDRPKGYRWLRFKVPAVAGTLRVPPMKYPWTAFVDSRQVSAAPSIPLPTGTRIVVLRIDPKEILVTPFSFTTVQAELPLGTWNMPGLEHFSGQMIYEKAVNISSDLLTERLLLDCGEVGVVATAWVHGNPAGSRAWAPFVFDVTEHVRVGENHFKVLVANTEANARAVGSSAPILKNIDVNGWEGPAALVPFVAREITLSLSTAASMEQVHQGS